jgi:hypothetical protein
MDMEILMNRPPAVWSCGYGTNSTALAVGLVEHGESYDLAMFADTGGERPELYAYQRVLNGYLRAHGLPPVMTVWHKRADMTRETLEEEMIRLKSLPSLAYGYRTCSQKHKIAPQEQVLNNWQPAIECWKRGEKVVKLIGYDAGEEHRATRYQGDDKYTLRFPLIEWGWGREECIAAIQRAGLPQPGKSSCFFCPATKKHEILDLAEKHPELANRAVLMEKNAELITVKGLGRSFSWADFLDADKAQGKLFPEPPEQLCACLD